MVAIK